MYDLSSQYNMILYIHPEDGGPIMWMELDLLSVETAVMGLDANSNRDDARVRELARRIKAAFPGIDPFGHINELALFMSRLKHVALFSGVVLRLPGTISGPPQPVNPTPEEFARMASESLTLKSNLDKIQQEYDQLKTEAPILREDSQRWIDANKKQQVMLRDLRQERDEALAKIASTTKSSAALNLRVSELEKEKGESRTREEQLRRENQKMHRLEDEVAALRQNTDNKDRELQQLHATIDKYKQEVARLKQESIKLTQRIDSLQNDIPNVRPMDENPVVNNHAGSQAPVPLPDRSGDDVKPEWERNYQSPAGSARADGRQAPVAPQGGASADDVKREWLDG